ncbi:SlyX family protein [Treponema sp. TIM-1]|uniref:SlyX family protein n=1 Tax=Treponema sp. TIM-1 TaxID=2898417 RepID=UPI00397EAAC4
MNQQGLEPRIEKIEIKLAFLEDFLNRLQEGVTERNALLDKLSAEHEAVKDRLRQLSQDMDYIPNQKPPHY